MCSFGDGFYIFFFKQKTADEMRISDWSSDVCSSDLLFRVVDDMRRAVLLDDGGLLVRAHRTDHRGAKLAAEFDGVEPDAAGGAMHQQHLALFHEIGRASCRERVCQYV